MDHFESWGTDPADHFAFAAVVYPIFVIILGIYLIAETDAPLWGLGLIGLSVAWWIFLGVITREPKKKAPGPKPGGRSQGDASQ